MADQETSQSTAMEYLQHLHEKGSNSLWTLDEQLQALSAARATASPSPLEEDWRKTNPDLFPWDRLEAVNPNTSRREVDLIDPASVSLTSPLSQRDAFHDLTTIIGDDYDAKFLYYHKAFNHSPVCVVAPKSKQLAQVEVIQRASGPGVGLFTTLIIVESGAELTLYDRWEAPEENGASIGRTEVLVRAGARLNYIQDDRVHDSGSIYRRARVRLERDSALHWTSMTPGAGWHAARLEVMINGENVEAHLNGLFTGSGTNRADHRTHQYHGAPRSRSTLTFKTLLAGKAHSIYQGIITVPQQSQKTDAYQKCRNLMLDPGTHADAIPKLEIIADDVKCSHGATIGSLNAEQMFYMRTRGLSYREALTAVAMGFAEEIIQKVPLDHVQKSWRDLVNRTIGQAGAK